MELVTVYIATKNRAHLLTRALSSLLTQTIDAWRCIVVDDGSTDDTPKVIRDFSRDIRIASIRFNESLGSCAARNAAIAEVNSEFVTGLDDDDMFLPDRLERLLEASTRSALVGSRDLTLRRGRAVVARRPKRVPLSSILLRNMLGNQALMRTADVRAVGGFDVNLPSSQDHDLWVRLIERCGPATVLPCLGQIIFEDAVPNRITSNGSARLRGMKTFLAKHQKKMSSRCKHAHQGKILALEGRLAAINHSLLGLDPSIEGLKELRRSFATLVRSS